MSKLSKSLCNVLASQISHQKQPWSEKILQMSEMFKIWFQNTSSSGWACQVFSYDKGRNTYILSSYLPALYFLSGLNLTFTACVACKIQYLDQKWSSSNLIFQTQFFENHAQSILEICVFLDQVYFLIRL